MAIQWFPGHMHLTKKAIQERMKAIDVVIELLDARLPGSSANPMLAELTSGKPGLKVLNKQDLADLARLDRIQPPATMALRPGGEGPSGAGQAVPPLPEGQLTVPVVLDPAARLGADIGHRIPLATRPTGSGALAY